MKNQRRANGWRATLLGARQLGKLVGSAIALSGEANAQNLVCVVSTIGMTCSANSGKPARSPPSWSCSAIYIWSGQLRFLITTRSSALFAWRFLPRIAVCLDRQE